MQAINRQIAHYAYHVGQIVLLAKHYQHAQWRSLSVPRGGNSMRGAAEFLKARDFLLSHRTGLRVCLPALSVAAKLGRIQLGAGLLRRMAAGNTSPRCGWWTNPARNSGSASPRCRSARIGLPIPAGAGRAPRRPHAADAGQRSAAVGNAVGGLQAGRRGDSRRHLARSRRSARPPGSRRGAARDCGRRAHRQVCGPGGEYTRICAGGPAAGWHSLEDAYQQSGAFTPEGVTRATDPLLLYFTSGTTAKPKLVHHSHQSYPVGHLSTMYWIGLQPGDVHWNISSPGWAKHAWSCWFAPWNAGATVFAYNYARFNAKAVLHAGAHAHYHAVRAAHRLAHAGAGEACGLSGEPAGGSRPASL
jgi:hypothetical protein